MAGLKKRLMSLSAICAYSALLITLGALTVAQSGMLPAMQLSTQSQLNQAVTGNDVLAYLQKTHGSQALTQPRYQQMVARMKQLGDKPVSTFDWTGGPTTETPALTPVKASADISVATPAQVSATPKKIDG